MYVLGIGANIQILVVILSNFYLIENQNTLYIVFCSEDVYGTHRRLAEVLHLEGHLSSLSMHSPAQTRHGYHDNTFATSPDHQGLPKSITPIVQRKNEQNETEGAGENLILLFSSQCWRLLIKNTA